jgi:uncharacterized protein YdhG (YjbR/CyaY superfamily)
VADEYASIDEYIASFPEDVQIMLEEIRQTVRDVVPTAKETMSYRIPTFTLNDRHLVYFAGWKRHIALYPVPDADEALSRELAPYRASKGTLRFPLNRPVPYELIRRLVALLVTQRASGTS